MERHEFFGSPGVMPGEYFPGDHLVGGEVFHRGYPDQEGVRVILTVRGAYTPENFDYYYVVDEGGELLAEGSGRPKL